MLLGRRKLKKKPAAKADPKFKGNMDFYRNKLDELRNDLLKIVQKKKEEEVLPEAEIGDEADVAVRSLARELVFELSGNERHMLEGVEAALRRIEKGTFGICEANGEKITKARLKFMPYARYCIKCQARFENS